MKQDKEVRAVTREEFEHLNIHYRSAIMVLVQKGEMVIVEGEA